MPRRHPTATRAPRALPTRGFAAGLAALAALATGCAATAVDPAPPQASASPFAGLFALTADGGLAQGSWRAGRIEDGRLLLDARGGEYVSPWLAPAAPFDRALVSWNVDRPAGAGFAVELQAAGPGGERATPWLLAGEHGLALAPGGRVVACEGARVDVDLLVAERPFERLRLRVRALGGPAGAELGIAALFAHPFDAGRARGAQADAGFDPARATPPIAVPPRSQRAGRPALAPRLCSPTSVAMVLEHAGIARPAAQVAALAYDPVHDLYGNWPRAVQAAWSLGLPGCVTRFERWSEVDRVLALGQPIVASVRAAPGELGGAPYASTAGHLLVVCGFDARGDVVVRDPAAAERSGVPRTYRRAELARVWLENRHGVAYVLGRPFGRWLARSPSQGEGARACASSTSASVR